MSPETIRVYLCTASLKRQLCHCRLQIALGWNWPSRFEMQQGMVGGRVGFLVAGLWEGVRWIIENVIVPPAIFLHVAVQCPFTSLLPLWRFFGPLRSRTSQVEIDSASLIHGQPCLRFRTLVLAYSSRIVLQTS